MKGLNYISVFLLFMLCNNAFAQQCSQNKVVIASGGIASDNLMITVGEAIIYTGTGAGVELGYQSVMPYSNCASVTAVIENAANNADAVLFPNPATDNLTISNLADGIYHCRLLDYTGKLIADNILVASNGKIQMDVSRLTAAFYALSITGKSVSDSKTLKFIKTY